MTWVVHAPAEGELVGVELIALEKNNQEIKLGDFPNTARLHEERVRMTMYVYISLAGDDVIRSYEMDNEGHLQFCEDTPLDGGPSALAAAPDGQTLYCSLRGSNEVAALRFEIEGGLQPLGKRQLTADSCYLATDNSGRFLLGAYYGAGLVTVHRVESDGTVGPEVSRVETAQRAHCIETDEDNRFALVPHPLDANSVFLFQFDDETGQLTPNPGMPRFVAREGLGPRHFVFSLNQRFVYTSDEDGSSVSAYGFERPAVGTARLKDSGCTLRHLQTLSSLPSGFEGENTCSQIHLHPSGRTLYVSNRGHDSIAIFSVDVDSGTLSHTGWKYTEPVPRVFNIDPSGRFLLAAGQGSGNAISYVIDQDNGMLAPLDMYEVGNRPMWVLFREG